MNTCRKYGHAHARLRAPRLERGQALGQRGCLALVLSLERGLHLRQLPVEDGLHLRGHIVAQRGLVLLLDLCLDLLLAFGRCGLLLGTLALLLL